MHTELFLSPRDLAAIAAEQQREANRRRMGELARRLRRAAREG